MDVGGDLGRLLDQGIDIVVVGMRRAPEYTEQLLHIVHRMFGLVPNGVHRRPCQLHIMGGGIPPTVGLDDDDRKGMGHDVVHVTGDARTFGRGGDEFLLLLPGGYGRIPLAQHADRVLARPLP